MGTALLQIKIMPDSPDTNLDELKQKVQKKLEEAGALKVDKFEEQEIAFGLKAIIVTLAWPEEKETEDALNAVKSVEKVSSADIIDYRRAFG